ncbi:hypothetical protein FQR65_LT19734 [Abscondita terminalis]|nr:hypothetical protein FQR65_LT19734 [Abscondita terminalis]
MKFESGAHRVQRVPKTESKGRIQTSTATVAVLPEMNEVEIQIKNSDLRIDTYRSSGAGGRGLNKMFLSPFAKMKKLQEEQEKKLQEEGRREIYIRDFSSKLGVEISDGKYKPSEESNDSLEKELSSILKSDSPSLEDFSPLSNKKIPAQVYDEYEFSTENEEELKNFFEVSDNLLEDAAVNPSKISKRNFKYNKFRNSNQQFVGLVGNSKDIILEINHFKAVNEDEKVVQINVERLFAYSSPYLFMIKKIINQFDLIKEKDKEFL